VDRSEYKLRPDMEEIILSSAFELSTVHLKTLY
jgi:hypothetical protein